MGQNASLGGDRRRASLTAAENRDNLNKGPRSLELPRRAAECKEQPHRAHSIAVPPVAPPNDGLGSPVAKFTIKPPCSAFESPGDSQLSLVDEDGDEYVDECDDDGAGDGQLCFGLTPEQVALLKQTFETIKLAREYIGWKGMQEIFEKLPDVAQTYKNSPHMVIRKGESWELMGQGVTFVSGIERFLLRITKPRRYKAYAHVLALSHRTYAVSLSYMMTALEIFQSLFIAHLTVHSNSDDRPFDVATMAQTWTTFFDILRQQLTIAQQHVNNQPQHQLQQANFEDVNDL